MRSKKVLSILALICVFASAAMYFMGSNDSKLTELKDTFWLPLILAAVFFLLANVGKKTA